MAPLASRSGSDRLDYLDGVRGLAALAVVWGHFCRMFGVGYLAHISDGPLRALFNATAAVAIFFVLSGLVLSLRPLRRPDASEPLLGFYLARFIRLCIPCAGALILSKLALDHLSRDFATDPAMPPWGSVLWYQAAQRTWSEIFAEMLLIIPDSQSLLLPQGWTLAVELRMALLLPAMVLVGRRSGVWLLLLCALGYWLFALPIYVAHFALGLLLAKHRGTVRDRIAALPGWQAVILGVVGLYLYNYQQWPPTYWLVPIRKGGDAMWLIMAVGATSFLALALARREVQEFLRRPSIQFLGRISYSLYLVHFLVLIQIAPLALEALNRLGLTGDAALAVLLVVATGLCLGGAELFWRFVERPAHRLGRRVSTLEGWA